MAPDAAPTEPEIDPISARYVWGPDEMTEALWAYARHQVHPAIRSLLNGVIGLIILLGIATIAAWAIRPENRAGPRPEGVFVGIFVVVFFSFLYYAANSRLFQRLRARGAFRAAPNSAGLVDWIFGADEIRVDTPIASTAMLWPIFIKVVETPGGFLFFQQARLFQWIPGHAFRSAGEASRLVALARSRVPRYSVAGECRFVGKPGPDGRDEV